MDAIDRRLTHLVSTATREVQMIATLLPQLLDVQWDRSPTGGPENATGVQTSDLVDPTAAVATDLDRLYLRRVLRRTGPVLETTVATLTGTRRGLQRALRRWEGPEALTPTAPTITPEAST